MYGDAAANDRLVGARPVGLLHDFSFVDDWLKASPATSSERTVRYSLTRADQACEELRACPPGTRETYWNCLVGATEAGVARCKDEARRACSDDDD